MRGLGKNCLSFHSPHFPADPCEVHMLPRVNHHRSLECVGPLRGFLGHQAPHRQLGQALDTAFKAFPDTPLVSSLTARSAHVLTALWPRHTTGGGSSPVMPPCLPESSGICLEDLWLPPEELSGTHPSRCSMASPVHPSCTLAYSVVTGTSSLCCPPHTPLGCCSWGLTLPNSLCRVPT